MTHVGVGTTTNQHPIQVRNLPVKCLRHRAPSLMPGSNPVARNHNKAVLQTLTNFGVISTASSAICLAARGGHKAQGDQEVLAVARVVPVSRFS